jgi:CelD/BcsL family acetyltransferase involved in cellulose biosynthesis
VKVVRSLGEPAWRRFIDGHPDSNVFHTPEMFQVFARAKKHRPTLWAVTDEEASQVLALLTPVQITLHRRLGRLAARAVAYGSVLHAPGPKGREGLALLLRTYTEQADRRTLFTELRNLSNLKAAQPILQQHGFQYEDHLNYLIDLKRPPAAILQDIGSRTRKHIRRGLRRGEVVVEEATEQKQIAACYALLSQSYQAAQVPLADVSLFEAAFDILSPKDMVRFALAYVDQVPVATSVELLYKNTAYGWYGGVDRDYGSYMPNELLTWHILKWSAETGRHLYDFGGAGKPDEEYGVRDFKAKFGGDLVCYGRNTYVHAPLLLRLSEWGYAAVRRLHLFGKW